MGGKIIESPNMCEHYCYEELMICGKLKYINNGREHHIASRKKKGKSTHAVLGPIPLILSQ